MREILGRAKRDNSALQGSLGEKKGNFPIKLFSFRRRAKVQLGDRPVSTVLSPPLLIGVGLRGIKAIGTEIADIFPVPEN